MMKFFTFGIYEANNIISFLYPTANTVVYINNTPTEHFEGNNISLLRYQKIASEKRNNCNPMRLALGGMQNAKTGFVRSQTEIGGILKRLILTLLFILTFVALFSQTLEMTSSDRIFTLESSQNEISVISKTGNLWKAYDENLNEIASFSLDYPNIYFMIMGFGRDFDEDNNFEVLFQYYDENYHSSIILKDIETGEIQQQFLGNSSTSYFFYSMPFYLNNERFWTITKTNSSNEVVESYLYRSGQSYANSNEIPQTNLTASVYPNPYNFNAKSPITIKLNLDKKEKVSVGIYNLKGQKINSLVDDKIMKKGEHTLLWNGKDANLTKVPSGVYFYKIESQNKVLAKKAIILR